MPGTDNWYEIALALCNPVIKVSVFLRVSLLILLSFPVEYVKLGERRFYF